MAKDNDRVKVPLWVWIISGAALLGSIVTRIID